MDHQTPADSLPSSISQSSRPVHRSAEGLSRVRRIAFFGLSALFSLFLITAFNLVLAFIGLMLLPESVLLSIFGSDFNPIELTHRVHLLALSIFVWGMLIGTLLQLRRPENKLGPMLMALTVPLALLLGELASSIYTVEGTTPILIPLVLITLLHPRRRQIFQVRRLHWPTVGLAVTALLLWAPTVSQHLQLQWMAVEGDIHGQAGHWSYMVSLAALIVIWSLIGSTNKTGWQLPAVAASLASLLFGLQSLLYPSYASAAGILMAAATILWAGVHLAVVLYRSRATASGTQH